MHQRDLALESERIILGIDPGTQILGYGLIRIIGKRAEFIDMGVLNLRKERDHFKKLQLITENVTALIERFSPDELAVEAPFYGVNPQTMLKLGRAQGAAIASALLKDIPVCEYAPRSVKHPETCHNRQGLCLQGAGGNDGKEYAQHRYFAGVSGCNRCSGNCYVPLPYR